MFIAVASGKGGVGKTTSAIHLAKAFYDLGKDSVVIDANLVTPHVGLFLGAENLPRTIHDALDEKINIVDAAYRHRSGLVFVPGKVGHHEAGFRPFVFDALRGQADVFVVDTGVDPRDQHDVLSACDAAVIIVEPSIASMVEGLKSIQIARAAGVPVAGAIVNKMQKHGQSAERISAFLGVSVLGVIPLHDEYLRALKQGEPGSSAHFKGTAQSLLRLPNQSPLNTQSPIPSARSWQK